MTSSREPQAARVAHRRILVIFNPSAGRDRHARLQKVLAHLRQTGCAVTLQETTTPGHGEAIAKDMSTADYDVIVAAGGDGTINEIINGLSGKKVAVGFIPLGTANVMAKEIGLREDAKSVAHALAFGPLRTVRVGRANNRRFIMMAGVGFDANVVSGVSLKLKRRVGPLAYIWQAAKEAFAGAFADCDVLIDGVVYHGVSAVVCNGRNYGGPFIAAPQASLADDQFYVILMKGKGWLSVLRYGLSLVVGKLAAWHDVEIIAGRDITLKGRDGQAVQADGDIVAYLPVHITIDPEPLQFVYPPASHQLPTRG